MKQFVRKLTRPDLFCLIIHICMCTQERSAHANFFCHVLIYEIEKSSCRGQEIESTHPLFLYLFLSLLFSLFFPFLSPYSYRPRSPFRWLFHSRLPFAQFTVPTDNLLHTITFRSTTYPLSTRFIAMLFCFPLRSRIFIDYRLGSRSGLESFAAEAQYVKCEALYLLVVSYAII